MSTLDHICNTIQQKSVTFFLELPVPNNCPGQCCVQLASLNDHFLQAGHVGDRAGQLDRNGQSPSTSEGHFRDIGQLE